jgi:hypothetical protein
MDYPFRGDVSASADPFEFVYATTMAQPAPAGLPSR